mmetsp:Transcript_25093/g.69390  ORF Transcript_25093/g.69390 Transcript_25093/m.69390 type:complete len:105 (-) Transcript_25093:150-464(-)
MIPSLLIPSILCVQFAQSDVPVQHLPVNEYRLRENKRSTRRKTHVLFECLYWSGTNMMLFLVYQPQRYSTTLSSWWDSLRQSQGDFSSTLIPIVFVTWRFPLLH